MRSFENVEMLPRIPFQAVRERPIENIFLGTVVKPLIASISSAISSDIDAFLADGCLALGIVRASSLVKVSSRSSGDVFIDRRHSGPAFSDPNLLSITSESRFNGLYEIASGETSLRQI